MYITSSNAQNKATHACSQRSSKRGVFQKTKVGSDVTKREASSCNEVCDGVQVPEFRVAYTVTTDKLDSLYKRLKPQGVTMTALLAKAAGVALAKHPLLYAGTDPTPPLPSSHPLFPFLFFNLNV